MFEWGQVVTVDSEPGWHHQRFAHEYIVFIYIMFQSLVSTLKTEGERMRVEAESYQEATADLQKRQKGDRDSNRNNSQDKTLAIRAVCIHEQHTSA